MKTSDVIKHLRDRADELQRNNKWSYSAEVAANELRLAAQWVENGGTYETDKSRAGAPGEGAEGESGPSLSGEGRGPEGDQAPG